MTTRWNSWWSEEWRPCSKEPQRLLAALNELDARFRPELCPDKSHLSGTGHQLLMTRLGRLDVLGAIGNNHTYTDLHPHTEEIEVAPGLRCQVLDLETQTAPCSPCSAAPSP
jgi:hypothetical protein